MSQAAEGQSEGCEMPGMQTQWVSYTVFRAGVGLAEASEIDLGTPLGKMGSRFS